MRNTFRENFNGFLPRNAGSQFQFIGLECLQFFECVIVIPIGVCKDILHPIDGRTPDVSRCFIAEFGVRQDGQEGKRDGAAQIPASP